MSSLMTAPTLQTDLTLTDNIDKLHRMHRLSCLLLPGSWQENPLIFCLRVDSTSKEHLSGCSH